MTTFIFPSFTSEHIKQIYKIGSDNIKTSRDFFFIEKSYHVSKKVLNEYRLEDEIDASGNRLKGVHPEHKDKIIRKMKIDAEQRNIAKPRLKKLIDEYDKKLNERFGSIADVVDSVFNLDKSYDRLSGHALGNICNIDYDQYEHIILISDIHADLISFFMTLLKSNIMVIINNSDVILDNKLLYLRIFNADDREDEIRKILCDECKVIEFQNERTLFMVLGDIVDGKRMGAFVNNEGKELYYTKSVKNKFGVNELIIHILLHNLRVSAFRKHSNVIVLLGNHDMHAVFSSPELEFPDFNNNYVDENTYNALGIDTRKYILKPFYLVDSAIFKLITRGEIVIGYLSHASFSGFNDSIVSLLKEKVSIGLYNSYNIAIINDMIKCLKNNNLAIQIDPTGDSFESLSKHIKLTSSITWSRHYSMGLMSDTSKNGSLSPIEKYKTCDKITLDIGRHAFMIMGHCITNQFVNLNKYHKSYEDCNQKSCLLATCVKHGIPKLILIDNAISYSNNIIDIDKTLTETDMLKHNDIRGLKYDLLPQKSKELKFSEMLVLRKNNKSSHYDFIVNRNELSLADSDPNYYMLDNSSDVFIPPKIKIDSPYRPTLGVEADKISMETSNTINDNMIKYIKDILDNMNKMLDYINSQRTNTSLKFLEKRRLTTLWEKYDIIYKNFKNSVETAIEFIRDNRYNELHNLTIQLKDHYFEFEDEFKKYIDVPAPAPAGEVWGGGIDDYYKRKYLKYKSKYLLSKNKF